MGPRRTGLARLIAVLLLLQWAGAVLPHASAMAQLASAQGVELCTHQGKRQVLLDEDGKTIRPVATDCCTLCQAPPASHAAEPVSLPRPAIFSVVAEPFAYPGLPAPPPRAPPQQPRAPPHL